MPKHQNTAARRARQAAREGRKYTTALRDENLDNDPASGPLRSDWTGTAHDDVAVCGHHRRATCAGCRRCTSCDACYCYEDDLSYGPSDDHDPHLDHTQHQDDCPDCQSDHQRTEGYTRCWKCGLAYRDGIGDHRRHNPPYCALGLPTYPLGTDWSYLLGQDVTLVGRSYSVHGHVHADQPAPDTTEYMPIMRFYRTDPGYEDTPGNPSPFFPREWTEVHPAPPSSS
ncbi:hypothetical protein [Streptomyces sp. NPDC048659]|uniref:hypothetical protein n=1 Tax=Streptomyces sp. NPDC048659 TaxID=3155489 RepID=UPI003437E527